jgi:hypothetical protein
MSVEKVEESNNYRIVGPDGTTKYVNDLRELELTGSVNLIWPTLML